MCILLFRHEIRLRDVRPGNKQPSFDVHRKNHCFFFFFYSFADWKLTVSNNWLFSCTPCWACRCEDVYVPWNVWWNIWSSVRGSQLVWFGFLFWELYILFASFVGKSICGHAVLFLSHSGATASTEQQIWTTTPTSNIMHNSRPSSDM